MKVSTKILLSVLVLAGVVGVFVYVYRGNSSSEDEAASEARMRAIVELHRKKQAEAGSTDSQ
jgi:Tfp pilus assembly protein PilW